MNEYCVTQNSKDNMFFVCFVFNVCDIFVFWKTLFISQTFHILKIFKFYSILFFIIVVGLFLPLYHFFLIKI